MRLVELLERVPQQLAGLQDVLLVADHLQHVAELQAQAGHRGHLDVGAGDPRDDDPVAVVEVELRHGLAEHVAVGQHHAAEGHGVAGEHQVLVAGVADHALELIEPARRADHREQVSGAEFGRVGGDQDFGLTGVADARNDHAGFKPAGNVVERQAGEVRIGHHERPALERCGLLAVAGVEIGGLGRGIDAEDFLQQQQRADDAGDGRRVGDRIGQGRQRAAVGGEVGKRRQRLGRGPERRRVGGGPREDPEHRRAVEAGQPPGQGRRERTEDHDRGGQHVQLHPLLPQRREETGTELEADGEHEQDEPELLHEIERRVVHRIAEVPGQDAGKQHARGAEADAAELHAAHRHPEHADQRDDPHGMGDRLGAVEFEEPVHFPESAKPVPARWIAATGGGVRGIQAIARYPRRTGGGISTPPRPARSRGETARRHRGLLDWRRSRGRSPTAPLSSGRPGAR